MKGKYNTYVDTNVYIFFVYFILAPHFRSVKVLKFFFFIISSTRNTLFRQCSQCILCIRGQSGRDFSSTTPKKLLGTSL